MCEWNYLWPGSFLFLIGVRGEFDIKSVLCVGESTWLRDLSYKSTKHHQHLHVKVVKREKNKSLWISWTAETKELYVILANKLCLEKACIGTFWSFKFRTKGWSSSLIAEDLFAGSLCKQHWRKSFPSEDNVSGIDGDLCKTLNIAWGCQIKIMDNQIN